jgi:hypothetical protein
MIDQHLVETGQSVSGALIRERILQGQLGAIAIKEYFEFQGR